MSDRAYTTVTIRQEDEKLAELFLGAQDERETRKDGTVKLGFIEADYALAGELMEACDAGLVFTAQWDAGDEYSAGQAVSDGKSMLEMPTDRNGFPVISVTRKRVGRTLPVPNNLRDFLRLEARVTRLLLKKAKATSKRKPAKAGEA